MSFSSKSRASTDLICIIQAVQARILSLQEIIWRTAALACLACRIYSKNLTVQRISLYFFFALAVMRSECLLKIYMVLAHEKALTSFIVWSRSVNGK